MSGPQPTSNYTETVQKLRDLAPKAGFSNEEIAMCVGVDPKCIESWWECLDKHKPVSLCRWIGAGACSLLICLTLLHEQGRI